MDENVDENKESTGDTNDDDNSSSDEYYDDDDTASHVNCVTVKDFEKVRKAIENYSADTVINDVNGLYVIKPFYTLEKQMFSKHAVEFMRKAQKFKIIDLHWLMRKNKEVLENIFNFVHKSIKLVVESYNKFGITDAEEKSK